MSSHACRQAAEGGDADALGQLGHMYANGIGVPASNATARKYFQQSANLGHPSGHYGLGYLYMVDGGRKWTTRRLSSTWVLLQRRCCPCL